jgi:hypothetical protein
MVAGPFDPQVVRRAAEEGREEDAGHICEFARERDGSAQQVRRVLPRHFEVRLDRLGGERERQGDVEAGDLVEQPFIAWTGNSSLGQNTVSI